MKKFLVLIVAVFGLSCVPRNQGRLEIVAIPTNPILVPSGGTLTINGEDVAAPYFIVNQLRIGYNGSLTAQVLLVELARPGVGGGGYKCFVAGDDLRYIFSGDLDTNGQVVINANANIASRPFACSGIPIPSPAPDFFNIPLTIKVTAVIVDPANPLQPTSRATGTTTITVQ